ncbi:MAG: response regulator [Verrucomicrobia bacterium]|nr:response regulator [Verrucomicrobiota bacterium]
MASPRSSATPAALLVAADGRVLTAAGATAAFWPGAALAGRPVAELFRFELEADDPAFQAAQWEALQTAARAGSVRLATRGGDRSGGEVDFSLAAGPAAGTWLALLLPAGATDAPSPAAEPIGADRSLGAEPFAAAPDLGFFELDPRRAQARFSAGWKAMLGYGPDELADSLETWRSLLHPDDSGAAPDVAAGPTGAGTRAATAEYRLRHRDGTWRWVQGITVRQTGGDGTLERIVGLHLDLTERKELEESLLAAEERLGAIAGAEEVALFDLDAWSGVAWVSRGWHRLLGRDDDAGPLPSGSFAGDLPTGAEDEGAAVWLDALSGESPGFLVAAELRAAGGSPVPVWLGGTRRRHRRGGLRRATGFAMPRPETAPAPAARADETIEAVSEGVLVLDARERVERANRRAAQLLGTTPEALTGRTATEVFPLVRRHDGGRVPAPFAPFLLGDRPPPLVATDALQRREAEPLPIVWRAEPRRNEAGRVTGLILVFRNPDEMRLTPEELVRANRFEALGLLAGGIAHDFNNLLTTILGAVSLAKDQRDPSALADAERACLVAKGLTRQLLTTAKGGAGEKTPFGARDLLADAVRIAAAASPATVTVEVAEGTPDLHGERPRLLQVFQNLVVNALQAMPPAPHRPQVQLRGAKVTLAEGQIDGLPAGEWVELEVRDNGSGIPPHVAARIFDAFFTTKKHGTGLGLATVLSIVRQHGGQLALATEPGVGSAFTVYLPPAPAPAAAPVRPAPTYRFGTGRILLLDDDPAVAALTVSMLQSLEYKVDHARTGEEAVTLYQRYLSLGRPHDAAILDLTIVGGMGGEECLEQLRRIDPDVRAIIASGYDDDDLARRFLEAGACGYLAKPYRTVELGKMLRSVLGQ